MSKPKSPTAADIARKRWEGVPAEERSRLMREAGAKGGRKPSCACGVCAKCKAREAQRRWRANHGKAAQT